VAAAIRSPQAPEHAEQWPKRGLRSHLHDRTNRKLDYDLFGTLDSDLDRAGELAVANQFDETRKFWVGQPLEPIRPVIDAV
jgi:hypothetical protein